MGREDDLSTWLKAAAENKITTKNAWKSTLIDHFTDIDKFLDESGVNFQKAGCTLDGCMKVYATRVDDVSENTYKILNIFNQEEDVKKKAQKKKSDFIEKNLANINLKPHEAGEYYDPVFSSVIQRHSDLFVTDALEEGEDGTFFYSRENNGLIFDDVKIDFELEVLPICESLKEFKAVEQAPMPRYDEESHLHLDFEPNFDSEGEEVVEKQNATPEVQMLEETPFGYFKGWAGPCRWKVDTIQSKKKVQTSKPRDRFFLDFKADKDISVIYEKADTTMTKEAIIERRKTRNILPEDFAFEIKDLYKFIIKDGYFLRPDHQNLERPDSLKPSVTPGEVENEDEMPINTDEIQAQNDLSFQFEHSLVLDDGPNTETPLQLKAPKSAKRVDIRKLKDNVNELITQNKVTLSEIYKEIPSLYNRKESKDISIHFCLISLLHLANENGIELRTTKNNDVTINLQC